jgi:hypothetical protein
MKADLGRSSVVGPFVSVLGLVRHFFISAPPCPVHTHTHTHTQAFQSKTSPVRAASGPFLFHSSHGGGGGGGKGGRGGGGGGGGGEVEGGEGGGETVWRSHFAPRESPTHLAPRESPCYDMTSKTGTLRTVSEVPSFWRPGP